MRLKTGNWKDLIQLEMKLGQLKAEPLFNTISNSLLGEDFDVPEIDNYDSEGMLETYHWLTCFMNVYGYCCESVGIAETIFSNPNSKASKISFVSYILLRSTGMFIIQGQPVLFYET